MAIVEFKHLTLDNLAGGAVPELFAHELQRVFENIQDRNTVVNKPRKILVEIVFNPKEDIRTGTRREGEITAQVRAVLVPLMPVTGNVIFARDGSVKTNDFAQMEIDGPPREEPVTPITNSRQAAGKAGQA